jgi:16S rRNA G966 N2-methylase RsmD
MIGASLATRWTAQLFWMPCGHGRVGPRSSFARRGARLLFEKDRKALSVLRENITSLKLEKQTTILPST